tara:strand:+ start:4560 stop:5351 length:792 start_codon:yes stop_codon:yes gene_type:complete
MGLKSEIEDKGFSVVKLPNKSIIYDLKEIIEKEANKLLALNDTDEYHTNLIELQTKINLMGTRDKLIKELKEELIDFHGSDILGAQTIVYLRGVRPTSKYSAIKHEALPMHRENFYCDDEYINHQLNMHFPLFNYNEKTCMRYYSNSHKIPDENLDLQKKDAKYSGVERFSKGHKLGLPYNPKIIQNLISMKDHLPAPCKEGDAFLFSSKLIHGGGDNLSEEIRFSLDFATLPKKWLPNIKKEHFASYSKSSSHFLELSINNI